MRLGSKALRGIFGVLGVFVMLLALHYPFLRLPYFWDEAGYYVPAAFDFYHRGLLIPQSALPTGHTPLVTVYLGLAWRLFGFSPLVTRSAMILVGAATVVALYALGRRAVRGEALCHGMQEEGGNPNWEIAAWSGMLLGLSPVFFAQSSLAYLDLTAALFTTLAVLALLCRRLLIFAVFSSLAIMSKETAVVLLPVAWGFAWRQRRQQRSEWRMVAWVALTCPVLPLLVWTVYYRHATGYWTGNHEYLEYNLYSTLNPIRIFLSLLRRLYEVLIGGSNWLLVAAAAFGAWWGRGEGAGGWGLGTSDKAQGNRESRVPSRESRTPGLCRTADFRFLAIGLSTAYVLMLSPVGGAILPRYLLPIFPLFYLLAVSFVWRLPKTLARGVCLAVAACFVGGWFLNPPWPFPFEDNLAYADFVRLHQQAAQFLQDRPNRPRILTAWPASDELNRPFLGYINRPLRVIPVRGFAAADFSGITSESFDLLYLYSRKWEPSNNWLARFPTLEKLEERYFDYAPTIRKETLVARYRLKLFKEFERRGQWVRIYSRQYAVSSRQKAAAKKIKRQKAKGKRQK